MAWSWCGIHPGLRLGGPPFSLLPSPKCQGPLSQFCAAQHFLEPGSAEEAEMDLVDAVAAARVAVADALERVQSWSREPET